MPPLISHEGGAEGRVKQKTSLKRRRTPTACQESSLRPKRKLSSLEMKKIDFLIHFLTQRRSIMQTTKQRKRSNVAILHENEFEKHMEDKTEVVRYATPEEKSPRHCKNVFFSFSFTRLRGCDTDWRDKFHPTERNPSVAEFLRTLLVHSLSSVLVLGSKEIFFFAAHVAHIVSSTVGSRL